MLSRADFSRGRLGYAIDIVTEPSSEVGLRITEELLAVVGGRVAGTYVMPSFGRYEQAAELVRRLRAIPAARVDAPAPRP